MGIYLVLSCALLCCPGVSPVLSWAFPCSPARSCAPLCPHVLSCAFLGSPCSPVFSCALLCALLGSLVLAWAFLRCSLRALLRLLGSPVLLWASCSPVLSCALFALLGVLCCGFLCYPLCALLRSPALCVCVCECACACVTAEGVCGPYSYFLLINRTPYAFPGHDLAKAEPARANHSSLQVMFVMMTIRRRWRWSDSVVWVNRRVRRTCVTYDQGGWVGMGETHTLPSTHLTHTHTHTHPRARFCLPKRLLK